MPTAISPERPTSGITKLTNCRLVTNNTLQAGDIWISSRTGKILPAQAIFYEHQLAPDHTIDLQNRIVTPGFIDVQFNGAYGFDFSTPSEDAATYQKGLRALNQKLVQTGLTSYLPTIVSQKPEIYHKALPFLGPSGGARNPRDGAESLGAHVEGPFLSPTKNGIHNKEILRAAPNGLADLEACYGASNLVASRERGSPPAIKLVTAAPEIEGIMASIPELAARDIVVSLGHTEADYEVASAAVSQGATMITHLFNAMAPLHHRNPGMFGLLGNGNSSSSSSSSSKGSNKSIATGPSRPYFGLIADGIHLHPTTVKIAYTAHPSGAILVTDALALMGLEDGVHEWIDGDRIVKQGCKITREGTGTLAGGCASLIECLNNLIQWTGLDVAEAVATITSTPAEMLGLQGVKGTLEAEGDADLCVLSEVDVERSDGVYGPKELRVDQVWKFGEMVYERHE